MRCNSVNPSVWIVAGCMLVGGCATQGSQGPGMAYGYRAAPDFDSAYGRPGTRQMAEPSEMRQSREVVQFPSAFATGEIVVSFADRRLYYVEARGRAVSYPIAIPRDQDRWEGTTVISDKK